MTYEDIKAFTFIGNEVCDNLTINDESGPTAEKYQDGEDIYLAFPQYGVFKSSSGPIEFFDS